MNICTRPPHSQENFFNRWKTPPLTGDGIQQKVGQIASAQPEGRGREIFPKRSYSPSLYISTHHFTLHFNPPSSIHLPTFYTKLNNLMPPIRSHQFTQAGPNAYAKLWKGKSCFPSNSASLSTDTFCTINIPVPYLPFHS